MVTCIQVPSQLGDPWDLAKINAGPVHVASLCEFICASFLLYLGGLVSLIASFCLHWLLNLLSNRKRALPEGCAGALIMAVCSQNCKKILLIKSPRYWYFVMTVTNN